MQLTQSFVDLLQHFVPVFTAPTFQTFVQILCGWTLSQRHRYVTEVIFASGNVDNGHWSRFHRFFSKRSVRRSVTCPRITPLRNRSGDAPHPG